MFALTQIVKKLLVFNALSKNCTQVGAPNDGFIIKYPTNHKEKISSHPMVGSGLNKNQ